MVNFDSVGVPLPSIPFSEVEKWLSAVAEAHGRIIGKVNYLFCDDAYVLETNIEFLGHDYFTDIITFDYSHGNKVSGDIVISIDTVRSNAEKFSQPYAREFFRVVAHGLLHLCGINDKGPGEREIMELNEEQALNILPEAFLNQYEI
ncbi:MAG: rRNA maturation RNase YbeY [Candidatus Amulumruptor caecigallinarius]|nr:rRNA maturation RNase YbeY [Candidatus Amulumruptor caecigallinarius]